jgi:hypothetical protein
MAVTFAGLKPKRLNGERRKPGDGRKHLGIDDGPCRRRKGSSVLVVGAFCKGVALDGVLSTRVRRDGWNATRAVAEMICGSKFWAQLHTILIDGITLGGLNVVDIAQLAAKTNVPVLAVIRKEPDLAAMANACRRLPRAERRIALIERAGPLHRGEKVWFQCAGIAADAGREILAQLTVSGHIPEPIRLAHLIAGGIVTGQSGHRA